MKRSKVRDLKKGDIFSTTSYYKKGDRLYICTRNRTEKDKDYFGYIIPYALSKEDDSMVIFNGNYNRYPVYQGKYLDMNPGNSVTILDKGEIDLINLGS